MAAKIVKTSEKPKLFEFSQFALQGKCHENMHGVVVRGSVKMYKTKSRN